MMFPWLMSRLMLAMPTPLPICWGLVPPNDPTGPLALRIVWLSNSEKVTLLALYPIVLTFARLLPATSSMA